MSNVIAHSRATKGASPLIVSDYYEATKIGSQLIVDSWENIKDNPYELLGGLVSDQGIIVIADALLRNVRQKSLAKNDEYIQKTLTNSFLKGQFYRTVSSSLSESHRFVESYKAQTIARAVAETRFWLKYGTHPIDIEYSVIRDSKLNDEIDLEEEWYNILMMAYQHPEYLPYLEQGIFDIRVIADAITNGIDVELMKEVS